MILAHPRHLFAAAALALLALVWSPSAAQAHVRDTTGYSSITHQGATVNWQLRVDYDSFARAAALGLDAVQATDDQARATALSQTTEQAAEYLSERLSLQADGVSCPLEIDRTGVAAQGERPYAEFDLVLACHTAQAGAYTIDYEVFRSTDGIVDDHDNVVDYQLGGKAGRTILDREHTTFSTGENSLLSTGRQFVMLGFHHILAGLDHVLFVAALVLGARRLRDLFWAVTTFTLAHSVTIALAALGWVDIPPTVVEPLIALSIAFLAFDSLLAPRDASGASRHRLLAVFCFGLLHGLGFAGALELQGGSVSQFLYSLFTFNIGIELGQMLVIGLCLPVIALLRRRFERLASVVLTIAGLVIGGLGALWFVERLLAPPSL